jgi:hypothetical protein
MSRGLSAANQAEIASAHLHGVVLVKLEFDTPLYVHSGIGTITFESNDYLGVGNFGNVETLEESEQITPTPMRLTLNGLLQAHITEALDAGTYGDIITIYEGYRGEDGLLVDDPWLVARGFYEHSTVSLGDTNTVTVTMHNEISSLQDASGERYTDADQRDKFSTDGAFAFLADTVERKLSWGREVIGGGGGRNTADRKGHSGGASGK